MDQVLRDETSLNEGRCSDESAPPVVYLKCPRSKRRLRHRDPLPEPEHLAKLALDDCFHLVHVDIVAQHPRERGHTTIGNAAGHDEPEIETLLDWAARDNDRSMLYGAALKVNVP